MTGHSDPATASNLCSPLQTNFLKILHMNSLHFLTLSSISSNGASGLIMPLKLLLPRSPTLSARPGVRVTFLSTSCLALQLIWHACPLPLSCNTLFSWLPWWRLLWFCPITLTTSFLPPLLFIYLLVPPGLSPGPFSSLFYSLPETVAFQHTNNSQAENQRLNTFHNSYK